MSASNKFQNLGRETEAKADGCAFSAESTTIPDRLTEVPAASANPQPPRLAFSVKEAAEMLGVSEKSVRRLIDRRLLRPSRALRHLLIPKKEIERFLEETTVR
jgi:excisionase family DNA binding protein